MDEDLLGLGNDLGILLEKLPALTFVDIEPRILLVDFPIEDDASDDAEQELDAYPDEGIFVGIGQKNLDDQLDKIGRLQVDSHQVVLLVGRQEGLAIVDEIADERRTEERVEGEVDEAQAEFGI